MSAEPNLTPVAKAAWKRAVTTIGEVVKDRREKQNASWKVATVCSELVRSAFQFLDVELEKRLLEMETDRGMCDDLVEYYRCTARPVFEKLLIPVLWHQPEDCLGYVHQQIGVSQFKLELKDFFSKCQSAAGSEAGIQSNDAYPEHSPQHGQQPSSPKGAGAFELAVNRQICKSGTRNLARSCTSVLGQSVVCPQHVHDMYEQAFQDAGGDDALEEAKRVHDIERRTRKYRDVKRPRQNKEYDVIGAEDFFHEAAQKRFRFNMILAGIAEQVGGRHKERAMKTMVSSDIKVALKHGTGLRQLLDAVSSSIVFPNVLSLYQGLSHIMELDRKDFRILQIKDRMLKARSSGFRDVKIFCDCDSMVCELLLLLDPMINVNSGRERHRLQKDAAELLLFSAIRNYDRDARQLLEVRADPNAEVDMNGRSCLHHAASQNQGKLVNRLLEAKADPVCTDLSGAMPFTRALRKGHYKIAETLLRYTHNCFSTLDSAGQFKAKEMLQWWIDVIRYDKTKRKSAIGTSSVTRILIHLANIGPELRPVLNSGLFPLVMDGDKDMVERLLSARADVNAKEEVVISGNRSIVEYQSVLDAALGSDLAGATGMVPWLVQQGARTLKKRQWRQKDLFAAADAWDLQTVKCLWEQGVNLGCEDANGCTMMDLLLKDINPRARFSLGVGSKVMAFRWVKNKLLGEKQMCAHHLAEACLVLDADDEGLKVRFHHDDEEQYIPYEHVPDNSKQVQLVSWLAEHGTPANQRWLQSEIMVGDEEKVKFLLQMHADVHLQDKYQRTPLHVAATYGRSTICKWLVEANASVHLVDQLGQTPLFKAKTAAVARHLLEATADLHVNDRFQNKPIHSASSQEVVSLLLSKRASIDSRNVWGEVPLHIAARGAKLQVVVKLLELRVSPDVIDDRKQTALHVAADQNIARSLVEAGIAQETIKSAIQEHQSRAQDRRASEHEKEQAGNIVSWLQSLMLAGDGRGSDIRKTVEDSRRQNGGMQRSDSAPVLMDGHRRPLSATAGVKSSAGRVGNSANSKQQSSQRDAKPLIQKQHWSEKALQQRSQVLFEELDRNKVFVPF
eukprot:gnl/MRDRNA2_/MRDRNA2_95392_c0_seq1.p1 gnl/MRDRNA2_/MRDRNA2_95392_c0~~gnl/MRDRNA2_/MRDRNA2_95392_c0_seq1.p1  ORF type:complete len:1073 (-),score=221.85 gnl/MRDRNA2_/MRDRNA2_95392_c0_seq1:342-3560(-)